MAANPSVGRLRIAGASGSIGGGKYRVFASLGRGGMADVQLGAVQGPKGFNKLVVIKRLRPLLADDPAVVNMFLDEARLAARLSHPNVVHTYEFGEERGTYFIAMEYLDGQSLATILQALRAAGRVAPPAIWAKIVADALAGLHHAHELCDYDGTQLCVVHRDVSPQNIVVTHDGRVKLVDFGIAKAKLNLTETESQIIKGKLAYMAPEQADPQDGEPLDRRADIFAMGIVLWECLAEKRLITGDARSAMTKIVDMEFQAPSRSNPRVPPELDAITLRALERAPEKRYQTALEMREALEGYLRTVAEPVGETQIGALMDGLFSLEHEDVKRDIRVYMERLGSERELAAAAAHETTSERLRTNAPSGPESPAGFAVTESVQSLRAVRTSATWRRSHEPPGRGVKVAAAIMVSALFVAGLATVRAKQRAASPPVAASASAAAPRPALTHFAVRVIPSDARVEVDGAEVPNPYAGTFGRDEVEHRVHVSRAGYVSSTRLFRFDRDDVSFDLTLEKAPEPPPPPPSGAAAKPGPPLPPAPKKPPKLDDDPWR